MTEYSEKRYLYGTLSVTHCGISNPSAFLKTMYSYLKKNPANIQMSGICPYLQQEAMFFFFLPPDYVFPITIPT